MKTPNNKKHADGRSGLSAGLEVVTMEIRMIDEPLFELHNTDGRAWKLYEDGTAVGFPDGTLIVNRAH